MIARVLGDSQGVGLLAVLGPVLAAHGYELDAPGSWTQVGASTVDATAHAGAVGTGADLVLVVLGGNDGELAANTARYRAKIDALLLELRRAGAREVVWVGPMHADDARVAQLHDAAREAQGSGGVTGVKWIDGYPLSYRAEHAGDGVHFTRRGYASIAADIERAVWAQGASTAIGLVGTLVFLGAAGIVAMEVLYARAGET
jgi:hypothetical protein